VRACVRACNIDSNKMIGRFDWQQQQFNLTSEVNSKIYKLRLVTRLPSNLVLNIWHWVFICVKLYKVYAITLAACWPTPVAARSNAWVCGSPLAGMAGSNSAGAWVFVSCECRLLPGWADHSISPTGCGVSECDLETSIMRGSWPIRGCCAMVKKLLQIPVPTHWVKVTKVLACV